MHQVILEVIIKIFDHVNFNLIQKKLISSLTNPVGISGLSTFFLVDLREVKEIRQGPNAKMLERWPEDMKRWDPNSCFVVFYGNSFRLKCLSCVGECWLVINHWTWFTVMMTFERNTSIVLTDWEKLLESYNLNELFPGTVVHIYRSVLIEEGSAEVEKYSLFFVRTFYFQS